MTDQRQGFGADEAHLDRAVEPEYAAISGWAVFSLILSAVGALALLPAAFQPYMPLPWLRYRLPILIVIPVTSAVLALFARRSIRHSGGTSVGLQPARIALGLSLVFIAGSLLYHGLHQRAEIQLQDQLQAAAESDLQEVFKAQYDAIFARLTANGAGVPRDRQRWVAEMHFYLYDGGDYYGRKLQSLDMRTVEESPEKTRLEGEAIYRLTFKEFIVDVHFLYIRAGDRWKLVSLGGAGNPMTAPKEGVAAKKRFE